MLGLTYIGAQVQKTEDASRGSVDLTRVLMLTESKLAELDTGLVQLDEEADNEIEGDFSLRFPDYGWRMRFDETVTEKLRAIKLDILYAPRESLEDEFIPRDAKVVHTVYTMRAEPTTVDLKKDFGIPDDAIEQLAESIPLEGFDPSAFDVSIFQFMETEELFAILPSLLQMFGLTTDQARNLMPPEFRELLDQAELSGDLDGAGSGVDGGDADGASGGQDGGSGDRANPRENLTPEEEAMLRELESELNRGSRGGGGESGPRDGRGSDRGSDRGGGKGGDRGGRGGRR
jgi:hypothetical protein